MSVIRILDNDVINVVRREIVFYCIFFNTVKSGAQLILSIINVNHNWLEWIEKKYKHVYGKSFDVINIRGPDNKYWSYYSFDKFCIHPINFEREMEKECMITVGA